MKTISFLIVLLIAGCCPTKEIERTTTTYKDTTIIVPPIEGTAYIQDSSYVEYLHGLIADLQIENDSLLSLPPDTVSRIVDHYIQSKPFEREYESFTVTKKGDSVFVKFRIKNTNGSFSWRVIAAPVTALIPETTHETKTEYQKTWYEKLWDDFRNTILIAVILIIASIIIYFRRNK